MIGKLKGLIDEYADNYVIVDVGGVGYEVYCSNQTLQALPSVGEAATVLIETHVREDQIKLFGFATALERDWFRLLTTVQGVGQKVALAILSTLKISELTSAIALQDKVMVARTPGVGPKVAQRIVSELKDKTPSLSATDSAVANLQAEIELAGAPKAMAEAVSALTNLGYAPMQANAAVATVVKRDGDALGTAALIRLALKELSQ
ncbi:Holliday junction branch migration protein RuvA [Cohaesibacter celericrescens]|uniref:Holliday junction branch migration complex subunit RuvA n=1 Tax=Cohaesibacter celericrescens TaxID=2067669 RepID=A0A2N5XL42_9HYPH|nr:Holliday junction branch migration protein RuvA [Cohaesibacter celericrescens]PLW75223.1 Holliday junction branch migration protein RuvA [Cohaesibacter celericrescens]